MVESALTNRFERMRPQTVLPFTTARSFPAGTLLQTCIQTSRVSPVEPEHTRTRRSV